MLGLWIRRGNMTPSTQHLTLVSVFAFVCVIAIVAPHMVTEPLYRHRSFGITAVVWRCVTPLFLLHLRPCIYWLVVGTILESIVCWLSMLHYAEDYDLLLRSTMTLCSMSVAGGLWCLQWAVLCRTMHKSQKHAEIEKEAPEGNIAMGKERYFS